MNKKNLWEKFLLTGSVGDYLDYKNKNRVPKKNDDKNNRYEKDGFI